MRTLDILLRTCSEVQVRPGTRVLDSSKTELIMRTFNSIANSVHLFLDNISKENVDLKFNINLTIVDDHSSDECLNRMTNSFNKLTGFNKINIVNMADYNTTGNGESMRVCYEYAKENFKDLIYLVEDDYIHSIQCIDEMIFNYLYFQSKLGGDYNILLYPVDCPLSYQPRWIIPSRVVVGKSSHWRTNYHTPWTMMLNKDILEKYWYLFMQFTKYTDGVYVNEDNTINLMYKDPHTVLFTPIPSLCYHLGYNNPPCYFIDWKEWWDKSETII